MAHVKSRQVWGQLFFFFLTKGKLLTSSVLQYKADYVVHFWERVCSSITWMLWFMDQNLQKNIIFWTILTPIRLQQDRSGLWFGFCKKACLMEESRSPWIGGATQFPILQFYSDCTLYWKFNLTFLTSKRESLLCEVSFDVIWMWAHSLACGMLHYFL